MKKLLIAAGCAAVLAAPIAAQAATETRAMMSKSCNPEKLKELSGGAITAIKPGPAANVYTISLDTAKMSWQDLVVKMNGAGCFK